MKNTSSKSTPPDLDENWVFSKDLLALSVANACGNQVDQILLNTSQHSWKIVADLYIERKKLSQNKGTILNWLSPLTEIENIAQKYAKINKRVWIFVRSKRIANLLATHLSEWGFDKNDNLIFIDSETFEDTNEQYWFHSYYVFDMPNFWKNEKPNQWIKEKEIISKIWHKKKEIFFTFFSRKWYDNDKLWWHINETFWESPNVSDYGIDEMLNNPHHWVYKDIVLNVEAEYNEEGNEQPTWLPVIEAKIFEELTKYPEKKIIWYVKNDKQKQSVQEQIDEKWMTNLELIVSDEIWYHSGIEKNAIAFFYEPTLDKATKAWKNILLNKAWEEMLIISVNTRWYNYATDRTAFNRVNDKTAARQRSTAWMKSEWKTYNLRSSGWMTWILWKHSDNQWAGIHKLPESKLLDWVKQEFLEHDPVISDLAILMSLNFRTLRAELPIFKAYYTKYHLTKEDFREQRYSEPLWIHKDEEYYKDKAQAEINSVFLATNFEDFLHIDIPQIKQKVNRWGKKIPYLSHLLFLYNKKAIKNFEKEDRLEFWLYIYEKEKKDLLKSAKTQLASQWYHSMFDILEVGYIYNHWTQEHKDIRSFFKWAMQETTLVHYKWIILNESSSYDRESILKLCKILYVEDYENIKELLVAKIKEEGNKKLDENKTLESCSLKDFKAVIFGEPGSNKYYKMLLSLLNDKKATNFPFNKDQALKSWEKKFTLTMRGQVNAWVKENKLSWD